METLLRREGEVGNGNDDRLDELSQTMKEGFAKSDREMKEGFAKVDREMKEGFARVDREMKEGFAKVDEGFAKVEDGFARIDRRLDYLPTRVEIDNRIAAANREMDHRFESTERRVDRVSNRLEAMLWGTLALAGGFLGNLLTGEF